MIIRGCIPNRINANNTQTRRKGDGIGKTADGRLTDKPVYLSGRRYSGEAETLGAFLLLVRFSGLFAFTQFFFQPRIEDLGRIVIPKGIRRTMHISRLRTCPHRCIRTSFRQILPQTALKMLDGRQPACAFLPCLQQNYARKSAHISYVDRF